MGPPPEPWPQPAPLDPACHFLDGPPEEVAAYLLVLDTVNFGSGWFPTLAKRPGCSGYTTIAWALADRFRREGAWRGGELRRMGAAEFGPVLGQRADHELVALYAEALRALGRFLGPRTPLELIAAAGSSAERLAETLAGGMAMFADRGFYKRAQITAADLALAGVAEFADVDRLTIFADNLVPPRPALRRRPALRPRPGRAHRRRAPARPGPSGGGDQGLRGARLRAPRRASRGAGAGARRLAVEPRPGTGLPSRTTPPHCRCVYY